MARQFPTQVPISGVPLFSQGKVREMYDLGDHFLMVASDRISAFDVVLPTLLPNKGKVLNQLSVFWFKQLGLPSHFVTDDPSLYPAALHPWADELRGRSMLVRKAKRFDVECVARGYIVGSGWKDYQKTGAICGHQLPPGLQLCAKLNPPLFTPAAKNDVGHDENIDFDRMVSMVGAKVAAELRDRTLDLYSKARNYAAERGIILADTKFEFGIIDGKISLIDEVLTPDSSRYWPSDRYVEGVNQESFDKQYLRDWLDGLSWNKEVPGPQVPDEVAQKTSEKYVEIFRRLVGSDPIF